MINNNNSISYQLTDNNQLIHTWNIGTLNVRGLNDPYKLTLLNDQIYQNDFDFIILTETKLKPNFSPKLNLENKIFTIFNSCSSFNPNGQGVAIAMKNHWAHHVEEINKINGRLIHLTLKFKGKKTIHIIRCYGPASANNDSKIIITKINNFLNKIITKNKQIIIAGNLNEDYIHYQNN